MSFADSTRDWTKFLAKSFNGAMVLNIIISLVLGYGAGMFGALFTSKDILEENAQLKSELSLAKLNVADLHKELKEFRDLNYANTSRAVSAQTLLQKIDKNRSLMKELLGDEDSVSGFIKNASCKFTCEEGVYLNQFFVEEWTRHYIAKGDHEALIKFKKACDLTKQIIMDSITLSKI